MTSRNNGLRSVDVHMEAKGIFDNVFSYTCVLRGCADGSTAYLTVSLGTRVCRVDVQMVARIPDHTLPIRVSCFGVQMEAH